MFILAEGMFKDAQKIAKNLLAAGETEGELPFSPVKPLTITSDPQLVGDMVSFKVDGVKFYIGFKKTSQAS
jgi:hypothetical protein